MSRIKSRLEVLEAQHAVDVERPIVLFDDADSETIERVKASGRMLILLSDSDGYEVWANGQRRYGKIEK